MKRRQVIYTADAGADLDWIYDIIAETSSPVTASQYEQRVRDFCDRLEYGQNAAPFATISALAFASLALSGGHDCNCG